MSSPKFETRRSALELAATAVGLALCLLLPGCPPSAPTGGGSANANADTSSNSNGAAPAGGPTDVGGGSGGGGGAAAAAAAAVTSDNIGQVAQSLDGLVGSTIEQLVQQLADDALAGRARSRPILSAGRVLAEEIEPRSLPGSSGTVEISGTRLLQRWPPRYDLTLRYADFAGAGGLKLTGVLEFSFVWDDSASPAVAHGIYRGSLEFAGAFAGALELHGAVEQGRSFSLRANGAAGSLGVGDSAPPAFVTFVSTIAGTGDEGFTDGPGAIAQFDNPTGVAVDDDGRVFVADQRNGAVREIDLDGIVHTVTGELQEPVDLQFDSSGLLVVSDQLAGSHGQNETPLFRLVVKGDARGLIIPIVAGTGTYVNSPFPLCPITEYGCDGRSPLAALPWAGGIDVQNMSVLVAEWALRPGVRLVLPDGFVMTLFDYGGGGPTACSLGAPRDVAFGNRGEVYFTTDCNAVRVRERDGTIRTLAGRLQPHLEFADGVGDAARFSYPEGLAFDGERYLFVADSGNSLIRRVDIETGQAIRVAGCLSHAPGFDCTDSFGFRDGPGNFAQFESPDGIALDRWGDLYVADRRNNAIRLVRIIADPQRTPTIARFDPGVAEQGQTFKLDVQGRNLTTVRSLDFGAGVQVQLEQAGYQRITARVTVAADAAPGPRTLTVQTLYGSISTPAGLSLTIMADGRGGGRVETIAGTGSAELDQLNYGTARTTNFAFPGGMHALSVDRLLVADPLEHRIRLIATRTGAVEEFFELLVYAASGAGVDVLGGIINIFDGIQRALDFLGIGSGIVGRAEAELRRAAEIAVDEICDTVGADDCEWLSLPWAGLPYAPGEANGFRLNSRFFIPTDIWYGGSNRFFIADAGNENIRVVGYNVEEQEEAPMQVFSTDDQPGFPYAVTTMNQTAFASVPADAVLSQLSTMSGAVNPDWAGVPNLPGCSPMFGGAQPLGVALGIASGATTNLNAEDRSIFVADPYCSTIWRVKDNGGVSQIDDIRGDFPAFLFGKCADGPVAFATFGAPADVAVDQSGNIYVADCGCNSIRVIKDRGYGSNFDGLVGDLRAFLSSQSGRISTATANAIEENLRLFNTDFLDANRYWVETLAGSPDGEAGFADGPAALARFNAPTSIAVATAAEGTVIFVGDTGNRRIRRIFVP